MNLANAKHAKAGVEAPAFYPPMTTKESLMSVPNFNTLTHIGTYRTRIEKQDDGSLVIVQVGRYGATDTVILSADLALRVAKFVMPKRAGRAA